VELSHVERRACSSVGSHLAVAAVQGSSFLGIKFYQATHYSGLIVPITIANEIPNFGPVKADMETHRREPNLPRWATPLQFPLRKLSSC